MTRKLDRSRSWVHCGPLARSRSEVEAQLRGQNSRRYVIRSTEGGQEIVEGNPVRNVDSGQLKADLVLVTVEKVVMTHGKIEEMPWRNAGGIVIGIVGSRRGD